jgi:hypothetical protein
VAPDRLFCNLLGRPGNIWIVVTTAVPVEAGLDDYGVHAPLREVPNVGSVGSPSRIRTYDLAVNSRPLYR